MRKVFNIPVQMAFGNRHNESSSHPPQGGGARSNKLLNQAPLNPPHNRLDESIRAADQADVVEVAGLPA